MQPIERYGVIALLFLMITIGAVVIWGPESDVGETAGHAPAVITSRTQPPLARERGAAQGRETKLPLSKRAESPMMVGRAGATAGNGVQAPAGGASSDARYRAAAPVQAFPVERGVAGYGSLPATKAAQAKPPLVARGADATRDAAGRRTAAAPSTVSSTAPGLRGATRSPKTGSARVYEVQPGDTLSEIAEAKLGRASRWREIAELNPRVTPERMKAGDKLLLPARGANPEPVTVASRKSAATAARSDEAGTYRVRPGDTLGQIAEDHLGSWKRWKEITAINPGLQADALKEGQKLVLPPGTVVAARIDGGEWTPTGRGGVR